MFHFQRIVATVSLGLALAGTASPIAAETAADCYEKVLKMCSEALDGARWYEKAAIGVMCTGMLAGCNVTVVLGK